MGFGDFKQLQADTKPENEHAEIVMQRNKMAFTNAQPSIKLTFHLQTLQPKNIQIVGLKYR